MSECRLASTKKAAAILGFSTAGAFMRWVSKQHGFPRPVGKHHLVWDMKAVDQYLDKLSNLQPESADHDDIIFGRLAGGKDSREISAHS